MNDFEIRRPTTPFEGDLPKFDGARGTLEERVARENIAHCIAQLGGVTAATSKVGATRAAIYFWLGGQHKISLEQAIKLNSATNSNGLRLVDIAPHLRGVIDALTS